MTGRPFASILHDMGTDKNISHYGFNASRNSGLSFSGKIARIILLIFFFQFTISLQAGEIWKEVRYLNDLLRIAENPPVEELPTEKIYLGKEALFCTGEEKVAVENNRAARLLEEGKYEEAREILNNALPHAALFFPFRYNLGLCYLHLDDLKMAHFHFTKAQQVVPQFPKTYLQLGYIYERWNRDSEAVETFREALRRNARELDTFILIGDIFFKRHQLEMAQKYYDASLTLQRRFPNGLLGRAKIQFMRKRYLQALNLLKAIDTKGDYDKSLHYYYGEAAFKLRDYKTAAEQYEILLKNRTSRFFLTNSSRLIEHKLNLSRQFIE